METKSHLITCEEFQSIQGEGKSIGAPSIFLRLAACNLRCAGFSYQHPETGEHLGCDTRHVWVKGVREAFSAILDRWDECGYLSALALGAHLILTGGEPLIQQVALMDFVRCLDARVGCRVFVEVETNATFIFNVDFLARIDQINASPKLSHAKEPLAFQEKVIAQLAPLDKVCFKFVVATPADLTEIIDCYIIPFSIPRHRVWLMPEGGTRTSIEEKQLWLVDLCKHHTLNFSTRLHILLWNEATGV